MARVQPPGKMPGRRRWLQRLLGACLTAAVLGWPATHAGAAVAPPPLPPPSGLSVTAADSSTVSLSWTAPTPPKGYSVSGYEIYQGTSSGTESPAGSTSGTSYTATGLTSGTTYYFYVTAAATLNCLVAGCPSIVSTPSSEVPAATTSPTLAAPTGLTATAAGTSQMRLSWAAPAPPAGASVIGYKIYDGPTSGGESPAGSSSDTSDTVTGLTSATRYYFEVTAVYQSCIDQPCQDTESPRSGEVSAATGHGNPGLTSQVIHFGPLASHVVGVRFTISASASSGLQVSFGSATPRVCSVSDSQVKTIKRGRCTITATQAGNADYAAAPAQTRSFRVKRAAGLRPQTIAFARPADVPTTRRLVRLSASASSGLAVSFRSDTPAVCSVSRRVVTTVKRGRCTITAIQAGNAHYAPAPNQTRSFQVGPVPPPVPRTLVIVLAALVLAAVVLAATAGALRLRRQRLQIRDRAPPRVRAEPHPDSPGTAHLRVTGPDISGTVRIEPHQAYVYSRLERARR